jgi:hypothetical protein
MEPWSVQLFTLLGVAAGALASFVSARSLERSRWQREETLRWDSKRLECYSEFASALRHFISIAQRISAGLGLPESAQVLDSTSGLGTLAEAEEEVGIKWERLLMLGSPSVIRAADEWRSEAWHLEWFARSRRHDVDEYMKTRQSRRAARRSFYSAVRADLGVVSGQIPADKGPTWWEQSQNADPHVDGEL